MNHAIKLFIHDSFFDAFSALPRKIQKKTREFMKKFKEDPKSSAIIISLSIRSKSYSEFMKKFKEDPKSSAINYEKISTFRDQSLRTVRIDQKNRV